jgi:Ca-activated chloride channel family protein
MTYKTRAQVYCAFILLILSAVAAFGQEKEFEDKTLSPYFFVQGDPSVDRLPLKGTSVDIAVSGVIADVRVVQTYRNEGTRPINATYMFPASTRAAVYSMRMRIGNQVIVAKIKEREAAKQEFEQAKKDGKSASLLEEQRPNVFSMKLANMMPHDEVEIELRYTELLIPTEGVYQVVYPTVVGPRYPSKEGEKEPQVAAAYLHEGEQPTSTLHISTRIAAGMPIAELSCPSHGIAPVWQGNTVADVVLDDEDAFQGNRDFILNYRLKGSRISSGLLLFQGEDENFFLYMAQPPKRVEVSEIPPREYIFVVDVSGSMSGFPLNTSKKLLEDLIGNLRPTDLFNVILFSGDSTALSESSLAANAENISRALQLIDEQRGAGGTELLPALKQAMKTPREGEISRSIVVITDGYISGEDELFDHIRANLGQANVFAFGIGESVNRYLIEGVAKAGMGEPFIVTNQKEGPAIAAKFREYIESPVLTNISVRAEGFETYDVFPQHLPDLLADRPVIVFGKWRGTPSGTFVLSGRTGSGEYSSSLDVGSVQPAAENSALRYLWARSRIAELSGFGGGSPSDDRVKEITALGLKYNLLTRYTSFIAVREKIVNPDGSSTDVDQPLPLPVGVTDMAIGSEPELWLVFACLAVIALFAALRRRITSAGGAARSQVIPS